MIGQGFQESGWNLKRDPKVLGRPPDRLLSTPLALGLRGNRPRVAPTLVAPFDQRNQRQTNEIWLENKVHRGTALETERKMTLFD